MHKFVIGLVTEWRKLKLPFSGETVIVALSGGADSLALLLAIDELRRNKKFDLRIVAAHFNHKLRGRESDADEAFVKGITADRQIELAVGQALFEKKGNLEENSRVARYEFLHSTARNVKAGLVITAHTMNDQAETFLLNLIRGSGIVGLSAMPVVRDLKASAESEAKSTGTKEAHFGEDHVIDETDPSLPFGAAVRLVRPLLRWARREDTENFCRVSGVDFRYDTMNEDLSFKRVRIRKLLIPMLKDFNPKIIETLARTAGLMEQNARSADARIGQSDAEVARSVDVELSIKDLKRLEPGILRRTVRSWLKARKGSLRSIGLKHVQAIEHLISSEKSGRIVELPGGTVVRRSGGLLRYENIKVDN
ncbi:MAG TPA: tRNA lysidine(34) synthetase TilS [Pyrinomonadaceae bacterium]|nr:tRNA lysidine(34) synthetase TilS [Pyrinomonadaceae bacterium]